MFYFKKRFHIVIHTSPSFYLHLGTFKRKHCAFCGEFLSLIEIIIAFFSVQIWPPWARSWPLPSRPVTSSRREPRWKKKERAGVKLKQGQLVHYLIFCSNTCWNLYVYTWSFQNLGSAAESEQTSHTCGCHCHWQSAEQIALPPQSGLSWSLGLDQSPHPAHREKKLWRLRVGTIHSVCVFL